MVTLFMGGLGYNLHNAMFVAFIIREKEWGYNFWGIFYYGRCNCIGSHVLHRYEKVLENGWVHMMD